MDSDTKQHEPYSRRTGTLEENETKGPTHGNLSGVQVKIRPTLELVEDSESVSAY